MQLCGAGAFRASFFEDSRIVLKLRRVALQSNHPR